MLYDSLTDSRLQKNLHVRLKRSRFKWKIPGLMNSKSFEEFRKSQKSKIDLFNDIYLLDFVAVVFSINWKLKVKKYL